MPRQRNTMIRKLSLRLSKAMFVICLLSRTLCAQTPPASPPKADSTVILNARVADGTGKALRKASVRIVGDRIAQIGNFKPEHKDRVIDAKGLVLAPGFIDIHNHSTDGLQTVPPLTWLSWQATQRSVNKSWARISSAMPLPRRCRRWQNSPSKP